MRSESGYIFLPPLLDWHTWHTSSWHLLRKFFIHLLTTNYLWAYTCDRIWFRGSLLQSSGLCWLYILITKPTPNAVCNLGCITLYLILYSTGTSFKNRLQKKMFSLENIVASTKQNQNTKVAAKTKGRGESAHFRQCYHKETQEHLSILSLKPPEWQ